MTREDVVKVDSDVPRYPALGNGKLSGREAFEIFSKVRLGAAGDEERDASGGTTCEEDVIRVGWIAITFCIHEVV